MPRLQTVRGPIDTAQTDTTGGHGHVFVPSRDVLEITADQRAETVIEPCRRGYFERMVPSHDASVQELSNGLVPPKRSFQAVGP